MHPKSPGSGKPAQRVRVRSRRLDQVDEAKLALAVFLMAKRLLESSTAPAGAAGKPEAALEGREVA